MYPIPIAYLNQSLHRLYIQIFTKGGMNLNEDCMLRERFDLISRHMILIHQEL